MTAPIGYVLTIAGCPYYFTTDTLGTLTSADSWWPAGAEEAPGILVRPDFSWSERAKPLDGDLEADGVTFRLHDATLTTGVAAGQPLFSYLATRDPEAIASSPITSGVGPTSTTIGVVNGAALDSFPRAVWIEREAVLVSSRSGNTLNVATRGYLGTVAERHAVDTDGNVFPEVFADFPWTTRRKVVLWAVLPDLSVSPIWAGFCQRAPRLHSEGAMFELQCEHLWTLLKELPAGPVPQPVEFYGVTGAYSAFSFTFSYNEGRTAFAALPRDRFYERASDMVEATVTEAVAQLRLAGSVGVGGGGIAGLENPTGFARREGSRYTLSFDTAGAALDGALFSFGTTTNARPVRRTTGGTSVWTTTVSADNVPDVALRIGYGENNFVAGLSSTRGLPSSWASTTTSALGYSTTVVPSMRVVFNEDWYCVVTAATFPDGPERLTGTAVLVPRKPGAQFPETTHLLNPPPASLVYRVSTDHWALGVRDGLLAQTPGATTVDWDFSNLEALLAQTGRDSARREWYLDGQRTVGEWVRESCLLHGCSPVIRDGRLSFHPWRLPLASADAVDEFTSTDIIGTTGWETWVEGFANRISVKAEGLTINATDAGSLGRYGPGRPLSLELAGMESQQLANLSPAELARVLLSRLALWSVPVSVVRIQVALTRDAAQLGDVVSVTDWVAPNGTGGRGLYQARGLVVSRVVNLGEGVRELEVALFNRVAHGYAPCVRVASWDSTTVAVVARNYVDGSNDYSGAEGVTDDGGAQQFQAGDSVQVIQRSANGTNVVDREVVSVTESGGTWRIELDSAVPSWRTSGIVDIRPGLFSNANAPLSSYVFVGDETTHTIDGTGTPSRRISP